MKESKMIDKDLNLASELTKVVEREGDGDTNNSWGTWIDPQRLWKNTEENENQRKNQGYRDHSIVEIGLNTEKGPRDLRRTKLRKE